MNATNTPLSYDPADPDKMKLPPGSTCGDCVHIRRCKSMFGHVESDTSCDWAPSRFHPAAKSSNGAEDTPALPLPSLTPAMRAEAAAFAAATRLDGKSIEQADA